MSATTTPGVAQDAYRANNGPARVVRRATETKSFIKTSEFLVWVLATAGVLLATYVKYGRRLTAFHGWTMITALAVGYMLSRGLAKAGSHEPYTERNDY